MGKGCDGEPRLWWGLCTMQVKAKCPSWDSGQTQGSPKPLDHIFAEFPNHSCQHHGSCGDCGGSSSALPTAKLVDPTGMVMEVNKKRKPRKNSHSLDMLPAPSMVGALSSLEPAPTSSQPTPAVGHKPLFSLPGPHGRGGHPPWLHSMSITSKAMPCAVGDGVAKWFQAGEESQMSHCKNDKTLGGGGFCFGLGLFWFFGGFSFSKKKQQLWGFQKKPQNSTYGAHAKHREDHRSFPSLFSHLQQCLDTTGDPRN